MKWAVVLVCVFVLLVYDLLRWCRSLVFGDYIKRKDREWCGKDT